MRLLILIPGLKIYTNWYHIFHIDIDTFATCKWIFEIWVSDGYLDLKNALKPILSWYMNFGKTIYNTRGPGSYIKNGDVNPTTTLPNQQLSHKLHKKNKGDTLHSMTLLFMVAWKFYPYKIGCHYFWPGLY